MKNNVYLALGSNIGDRKEFLKRAIDLVSNIEGVSLLKTSKIYQTEPVGYTEQDLFLNMAVLIETELEPFLLLEKLKEIEKILNRKSEIHWGPRTIDIDILLFGKLIVKSEILTIPHQQMDKRAFVLVPLKDICNDEKYFRTFFEDNIDNLINKCNDINGVKEFDQLCGG